MAQFDVIVCGAGPYGCFTALLLARAGRRVALIEKRKFIAETFSTGLGAFWPSPNDPPTRAVVAHGHDVALALNQFCARGVEILCGEIKSAMDLDDIQFDGLISRVVPWRFGLRNFERAELDRAVDEGLDLAKTSVPGHYIETRAGAILNDAEKFRAALKNSLLAAGVTMILGRSIISLTENTGGVCARLDNGLEMDGEMAVLGVASAIDSLLPNFAGVFVPMSDVCLHYEAVIRDTSVGTVDGSILCRLANGHIAARAQVRGDKVEVYISGPKFLLPGAGAGCRMSQEDLTDDLLAKLETVHRSDVFPELYATLFSNHPADPKQIPPVVARGLQRKSASVWVDCLPCDELPVLGDFGRQGKIIGTSGWIAAGYAASAQAARISVDLIETGKSAELHEMLLPRRLLALS